MSGNWDVWDIVTAWNWVRRNIRQFGGDPDRITMGGQSAGTGATEYFMTCSEVVKHLAGVALMSTSPFEYRDVPLSLAHYEAQGNTYMDRLGVSAVEELRAIPAMKWVFDRDFIAQGGFAFTWDYELFGEGIQDTFHAGHYPRIPMMIGSTLEERSYRMDEEYIIEPLQEEAKLRFGVDAENYIRLYHPRTVEEAIHYRHEGMGGDRAHAAVRFSARETARFQKQVYVYRFAQERPHEDGRRDSNHSEDVPYWFNTLDRFDLPWTERDRAVADFMMRAGAVRPHRESELFRRADVARF